MRKPLRAVELQTAYYWECPNCCSGNYAQAETAHLSDEDREEVYRHFHDLEAWAELPERWREFDLVTMPDVVCCCICSKKYRTISSQEPA